MRLNSRGYFGIQPFYFSGHEKIGDCKGLMDVKKGVKHEEI